MLNDYLSQFQRERKNRDEIFVEGRELERKKEKNVDENHNQETEKEQKFKLFHSLSFCFSFRILSIIYCCSFFICPFSVLCVFQLLSRNRILNVKELPNQQHPRHSINSLRIMNRQRRKSHLARSSFSFPSSTSTNISAGC
jgi:hypothetical protein